MVSLPPVQAITAALPVGRAGGQPPQAGTLPAVGELLVLLLERMQGGEWLASGPRGLQLRLPLQLGSQGERLTMQVLPPPLQQAGAADVRQRLALQLVSREAASPGAAPAAVSAWGPAMRDDQAWRLRLATPAAAAPLREPPMQARSMLLPAPGEMQPASLAAQWRGRVLAEVLRNGSVAEPSAATAGSPAPNLAGPHHLPGWNGQALLLRLLSPLDPRTDPPLPERAADEEAPPRRHGEAHGDTDEPGEGLRLGVILSLNGDWVQVLLQWQKGLLLHFSAEKAETLQTLRALLPRISAALAAVPLPLRHCQLGTRPPAMPPLPTERQSQGLAHASSNALFRAAAEIASVLQQPG